MTINFTTEQDAKNWANTFTPTQSAPAPYEAVILTTPRHKHLGYIKEIGEDQLGLLPISATTLKNMPVLVGINYGNLTSIIKIGDILKNHLDQFLDKNSRNIIIAYYLDTLEDTSPPSKPTCCATM